MQESSSEELEGERHDGYIIKTLMKTTFIPVIGLTVWTAIAHRVAQSNDRVAIVAHSHAENNHYCDEISLQFFNSISTYSRLIVRIQ